MLRHIVLFKFKENAEGRSKAENVNMTKNMLEALPAKIGLIKKSEVRICKEGTNPDNCDLLLISDFESKEALDQYIVHPDHKAVGAFMRPLREGRSSIDIEI